jgi:hypothetical protein
MQAIPQRAWRKVNQNRVEERSYDSIMAVTCLFLLFISSVLAAGVLLYIWGRWASNRGGGQSRTVPARPAAVLPPAELPQPPPPIEPAPRRLDLDDSSELRVADDELAYLWSDTEERRQLWRGDPDSIPPVEDLRRAIDQALETGDRKAIAFAKAALADALDPSRLAESSS